MASEQVDGSTISPRTETLFRYMGLSVFYYYVSIIVVMIIQYFFTHEFQWDLTFILYIWMACAIKDSSLTACKWGIFFMLVHGGLFIIFSLLLMINPVFLIFSNSDLSFEYLLFYRIFCLIYAAWSVINLKYLNLIYRRHYDKMTKANKPFWIGLSLAMVFAGVLFSPLIDHYNNRDFNKATEARYSEVINYLKKSAESKVPPLTDSSDLATLKETYPNVILARVTFKNGWSHPIINKGNFERTSYWGNSGTGFDYEGYEVAFFIYEEFFKNQAGDWYKIELYHTKPIIKS